MARIVLAWELGGGYGHLARIGAIGAALRARGHDVTFVVPAPARSSAALGVPAAACHDVTIPQRPATAGTKPVGLSDVLERMGYADVALLGGLLARWDGVLATARPDLVILDYAPLAALACAAAGVATLSIGAGFVPPPSARPLGAFGDGPAPPPQVLAAQDARIEAAFRAAAAGRAALPAGWSLRMLFDPALLCTFPEADHWGARSDTPYCGPIGGHPSGVACGWPAGGGPAVLAYVERGHPALPGLLAMARAGQMRLLMHVRGITVPQAAAMSAGQVRVSAEPIRLQPSLAACAAVVAQGASTIVAALCAGRPVVAVPRNIEQRMLQARLSAQDLAVVPDDEAPGAAEWSRTIAAALAAPRRRAAASFADRYRGWNQARGLAAACDTAERLAA